MMPLVRLVALFYTVLLRALSQRKTRSAVLILKGQHNAFDQQT